MLRLLRTMFRCTSERVLPLLLLLLAILCLKVASSSSQATVTFRNEGPGDALLWCSIGNVT